MFHEVCEVERFQTANVTFKVIQGHWWWCHSIGHVWFPFPISQSSVCLSVRPSVPHKQILYQWITQTTPTIAKGL